MENKTKVSITEIDALDHNPMFLMGLAYKQFRAQLASHLGGAGNITLEMYGALRVLEAHGQISQQQLANYLLRNRSVAKRLVDNGIKLGLIVSSKSDSNKKVKLLAITPLGQERIKQCQPIVDQQTQLFLAALEAGPQQQLAQLLGGLIRSDLLVD
ncbi:MarR family transcriptional regulator [uncultured Ferrimonas sp.]|uniref:MarR family winged helix-turn-helix transcriptional regulator n=1 Tax=uncultured Ferrimonas sp. TaxID=432640 RepID=UPI002603323D|nr:MarR family transcriptional regulator [uncultured Ferrimonas sp.]